ncbi:MAG: class I SAM-dependent methyltransferase [Terriglobia bacterium]
MAEPAKRVIEAAIFRDFACHSERSEESQRRLHEAAHGKLHMDRLTDVRYWEEQWWKKIRPSRLHLYRDFDYEAVQLLRRSAGHEPSRVLELGAGGSRVLPFLAAKFRHNVFGADFSPNGCKLLRDNLALARVNGNVVCEDLFQSSFKAEQFDLVFSCGLIEHFAGVRAAIEQHIQLLRPGGRVVLIIPNLQGLQGKVLKRLAPPLWARHRVFGPADLAKDLRALGLREVQSGYLGSFFLQLGLGSDWTALQGWPKPAQRAAYSSVRLVNAAISLGFRFLPVRPHSRMFSTGFFACGLKPER